jgi:hypothetical protein
MTKRLVGVALVHYPVLGRDGSLITTAITNLDVHDISRSACAFGAVKFFLVHPIEAQKELVRRVKEHWTTGAGQRRIPDRARALSLVEVVSSLEEAETALANLTTDTTAGPTERWTTAARASGPVSTYAEGRSLMDAPGPPVMLVFGTGWGLPKPLVEAAHVRLEPIRGPGDWNHLSVRAAAAITLERLLAPR